MMGWMGKKEEGRTRGYFQLERLKRNVEKYVREPD